MPVKDVCNFDDYTSCLQLSGYFHEFAHTMELDISNDRVFHCFYGSSNSASMDDFDGGCH